MKYTLIVSTFVLIASSLIVACVADTGGLVKEQPVPVVQEDAGTDCGRLGCPILLPNCFNNYCPLPSNTPILDNSGLPFGCQEYRDNTMDCVWCGDAAATCTHPTN
jgi:hypothetical protein